MRHKSVSSQLPKLWLLPWAVLFLALSAAALLGAGRARGTLLLTALQGLSLFLLLLLSVQSLRRDRQGRRAVNCFEALGRTYYAVALINAREGSCEVIKHDLLSPEGRAEAEDYAGFLRLVFRSIPDAGEREHFARQFSRERLHALCAGERERCYLEYQRDWGDELRWVAAEAFAVPGERRREDVIMAFRLIHAAKTAQLERSRLLRESLESARTAARAKDDFLSRMSHDMRTPMNAVIGFTDLARRSLDDREKAEACLDKVEVASRQLLHLINEVLDTAKIEQGKMELQLSPVDLAAQVRETASLFQMQAQAQGKDFQLEVPPFSHPVVETDQRRLEQILNNLLSNAVKYTPPGGSIRLSAREEPGDRPDWHIYRFTVSDTGIGMSPAFLERLFLPFEREDTSMSNQVSGVGLGMAITRNLVQLMGGRIDVESVQGQGSRFTVALPCPAAQVPGMPEESPAAGAFSLRGLRLLLAEDNPLNREVAAELLGLEGAQVTAVQDGRAAVAAVKNAPPGAFDAVLMDIQMPVLDGYAAARAIRALERPDAETLPILALTANAFADDVIAARQAGMNGHVAKPVDLDKLRAALAAVLR